ncbi:MAG: 60S ribosomal export protein NMD3 [Thermoplasmata archaeon]
MTAEEFCVVCGRTGSALTDGLCPDCAADRTPLVTAPEHAEVVLCPTCGARLHGAHWEGAGTALELNAEDLAPFLRFDPEVGLRTIRWEEGKGTATTREMIGHARIGYRGVERELDLKLSARTVHRTCPTCSRRSGKYYTAIVQLRGLGDDRSEKPRELRARLGTIWQSMLRNARSDWKEACSWREELPEGWNCYFAQTLAARSVARLAKQHFGAQLTESASLYGRKDGHDLYRVTFCLRFPRAQGSAAPVAPPGGDDGPVKQ